MGVEEEGTGGVDMKDVEEETDVEEEEGAGGFDGSAFPERIC